MRLIIMVIVVIIVGGVDGQCILWLSLGVSLPRPGILSDVPHSYRLGNGVTSFIAQEKF